ncbi:hypothetical protein, partial [Lysinibacillus sp. D4A3_S15]|uniref:hypothetical protein n=1 Tax=Lysinibacillus sp. D4A3_S15 TaxID=2941227 RepID=UPI0020BFB954
TKAQAGWAHIYLDSIQPALADPHLEKALEIAKYTPLPKTELVEFQRQYAENLVNLGKAKDAQLFIEDKSRPEDVV